MLRIPRPLYDAIVAHARAEHPTEACGIVSGCNDMPASHRPMINAAESCTFYEFDPGELLRAYAAMDAAGEDPVIIYHSHTSTRAVPSRLDVLAATEPEAHYVIVATAEPFEFRSWRIQRGQVAEEPVYVVDENDRFDPIRS
jgi:proteasome lid subunit RPN8/RPN11